MEGSQCKGCSELKDGKCTRKGNKTGRKPGEIGVCWMEVGEGEY